MSSNQDQATQATGTLVLFNGLPIVTENQWPLLARFLLRKLRNNGPLNYNKICMPVDGQGTTFGFSIVRFATAAEAEEAMNDLNGIYIDAHHQMTVEKVDVSERYRQARVIIPGLDEQLSLIVPLDYSRA